MKRTLAGALCLMGIAFGLYLVRVDVVEAQGLATGVILDKQGVQPPVTTVEGSAVTCFLTSCREERSDRRTRSGCRRRSSTPREKRARLTPLPSGAHR